MNKEEVLDFVDRVFFGLNALTIQMGRMIDTDTGLSLTELPKEYEEVRQYLKENLK